MKPQVQWMTEGVELPCLDYQKLEQWITQVSDKYDRIAHTLNYIFCNDEKIIEVNRQFLEHDYFTDIITFDSCSGKLLRGDMFISLDTVRTNADTLNQDYGRELLRVIIHGILHLCGINDKGPGEREIMESAENDALALYEQL